MAIAAILNLNMYIFGSSDPSMANIYLQTKFGANRSGSCKDAPVIVFPRWRPSTILHLIYPNFELSATSP